MKQCYAYIRVSTPKQGEKGVSLQEQRDAITQCATRNNLTIIEWFEERETAAKRGRPIFTRMLALLRKKKAEGVIIHKIDRGARNLRDWADINDISDCGIEVHFANEGIDLQSRGGRLSADIQAVVAADFIRNLREETRKGLYGRLKQGLYPLPAPIGYLNCGPGKPKAIDPLQGPLVREAFEHYATGTVSLRTLAPDLEKKGLRNRDGGTVWITSLSLVLNNPFYYGLIRLPKTGEVFEGVHEPLISKSLFDKVQAVLRRKVHRKLKVHAPLFRQLITCSHCSRSLYGESQKEHIYYRCHTRTCPMTCLREEHVENELLTSLLPLQLFSEEIAYLDLRLLEVASAGQRKRQEYRKATELKLSQLDTRLRRLTDALIDGTIDRELFEDRKRDIFEQRAALREKVGSVESESEIDRLKQCLELAKNPLLSYETQNPDEKRQFIKEVVSNRSVTGKNVEFSLDFPYTLIASRWPVQVGCPTRGKARMTPNPSGPAQVPRSSDGSLSQEFRDRIPEVWDDLISKLLEWLREHPE
jgi:DNA invertase Pin-like site-specific DNA recombinase